MAVEENKVRMKPMRNSPATACIGMTKRTVVTPVPEKPRPSKPMFPSRNFNNLPKSFLPTSTQKEKLVTANEPQPDLADILRQKQAERMRKHNLHKSGVYGPRSYKFQK